MTTHFHLVTKLRGRGAIPPRPTMPVKETRCCIRFWHVLISWHSHMKDVLNIRKFCSILL